MSMNDDFYRFWFYKGPYLVLRESSVHSGHFYRLSPNCPQLLNPTPTLFTRDSDCIQRYYSSCPPVVCAKKVKITLLRM